MEVTTVVCAICRKKESVRFSLVKDRDWNRFPWLCAACKTKAAPLPADVCPHVVVRRWQINLAELAKDIPTLAEEDKILGEDRRSSALITISRYGKVGFISWHACANPRCNLKFDVAANQTAPAKWSEKLV